MRRVYLLSCFAPLGPCRTLRPLREAVPAHSGTTAQHVVSGPLPQPHRRLSSLGAIGPSPLHSAFYLLRQLAFARECGAFGRDPCAAVAGESNYSRTGANLLRCTYAPPVVQCSPYSLWPAPPATMKMNMLLLLPPTIAAYCPRAPRAVVTLLVPPLPAFLSE